MRASGIHPDHHPVDVALCRDRRAQTLTAGFLDAGLDVIGLIGIILLIGIVKEWHQY